MAVRGAAFGLAVLLVAALATSAAGQPSLPALPAIAEDHEVLAVQVPLDAGGAGSLQIPVSGGILDVQIDPILLAGPGGTADVQAYLAHAVLLLPDGASLPLPSMVILPEARAIDGPAGQSLADLANDVERLRSAVQDLQGDPADPADPVIAELEALQEEIGALAAEAELVQAFADEAAAAAGDGVADQLAIASAMLARVEAGLAYVQEGLGRLEQQVQDLAPLPSSSASPNPSPTPSPTTSSSPSPPPALPDLSELQEPLLEAINEAQAYADEALAGAEEARAALEWLAGGTIGFLDDRVDQQALIDGAMWAMTKVEEALVEGAGAVDENLSKLQTLLQDSASDASLEAQAAAAEAASAANETAVALADMIADLGWAADWIAEAQSMGPAFVQDSLADAARSVDSANATAHRLLDLVEEYSPPQAQELGDDLAQQVEDAQALLPPEVQAAKSALEAALADMQGMAGGLDPVPTADVDDANGLAVCIGAAASQVCLTYRSPAAAPLGTVTVLVALPVGPPLVVELPGSLSSLTALPTVSSTPTLPPLPPPPLPPLSTGLPGGSASTSSSAAPAPGSSSSSSAASSSSSAATPRLSMATDMDALALRMGEQGSVVVTVRNEGPVADRVRLTAQTDAPITVDSPTEVLDLAPGAEGKFTVRVTPLEAGSGTLDLLATGEKAGTVKDAVAISVANAAMSAANIAASLEPSALHGAVGQALVVTVRLSNNGPMADRVVLDVSGPGVTAEPARIDVQLQPSETAVREVRLTPQQEGNLEVVLSILSDRGADLRPLLLLDAEGALDPDDGSSAIDEEPAKRKDTPAVGVAIVAAAIAVAFLGMRRRLEK